LSESLRRELMLFGIDVIVVGEDASLSHVPLGSALGSSNASEEGPCLAECS
jgi:hypothetical protein